MNESNLQRLDFADDRQSWGVRFVEKHKNERFIPLPRHTQLALSAYLSHPELAKIDRDLAGGDKVLIVTTNNRATPTYQYVGEERRFSPPSINKMM